MVKKAFLRANIPFSVDKNAELVGSLPEGWSKCNLQGDSLLKHINTSFEENVVYFTKQLEDISFTLPMNDPGDKSVVKNYEFKISEIHVFCFDTGIGIVSLHIPYDSDTSEEAVVNTCSALRCSANYAGSFGSRAIIQNGSETYLSCIAEQQLTTLLGSSFTLFNHSNNNSMRRIDMFSAVLCDVNTLNGDEDAFDKLCYRLSNTYDDRDKNLKFSESDFYRQQEYIRWGFSNRGCSVVGNLTGLNVTDGFLQNRWIFSVKNNYFCLYLMVLHQKYAIYNYLNAVASDADKNYVKYNQKSLIDFNSKYIFTIVSDENFLQSVYLRMKEVNKVDEVYTDLLDELKRLFEYSRLKNEESNEIRNNRLNIISVIISVLCSITIIFDTINMFSTIGCHIGFGSGRDTLYTGILLFEALLFFGCLIFVFISNKTKKGM